MNRQERVQEVYNYLVFTHAIENQRGFANSLKRSENNISRAIHGDPKFLTDRLLKAIAARYPFISLGWLLKGTEQNRSDGSDGRGRSRGGRSRKTGVVFVELLAELLDLFLSGHVGGGGLSIVVGVPRKTEEVERRRDASLR
jgi:hypothetical protein